MDSNIMYLYNSKSDSLNIKLEDLHLYLKTYVVCTAGVIRNTMSTIQISHVIIKKKKYNYKSQCMNYNCNCVLLNLINKFEGFFYTTRGGGSSSSSSRSCLLYTSRCV